MVRSLKSWWVVLFLLKAIFIATVINLGTIFFINRTPSMPIGIYIKIEANKQRTGDIIIFRLPHANKKLVKYIAATPGSEYCRDGEGGLWVNSAIMAQKNTDKYPNSFLDQSHCNVLEEDQFLVLGEHPNSYDSRYFGPIKSSDILATVKILWSFD